MLISRNYLMEGNQFLRICKVLKKILPSNCKNDYYDGSLRIQDNFSQSSLEQSSLRCM